MAGGGGTRLWPLSRADKPKPFLPLLEDGRCLLAATVARLSPLIEPADVYVVTDVRYADARPRAAAGHPRRQHPRGARGPQHRGRGGAGRGTPSTARTTRSWSCLPADQAIARRGRLPGGPRRPPPRAPRAATSSPWASSPPSPRRATATSSPTGEAVDATPAGRHVPRGALRGEAHAAARAQELIAGGACLLERRHLRVAPRRRAGRPGASTRRTSWAARRLAGATERRRPRRAGARAPAGPARPWPTRTPACAPRPSTTRSSSRPRWQGRVAVVPAAVGWSDLGSWAALRDHRGRAGRLGRDRRGSRARVIDVGSRDVLVHAAGRPTRGRRGPRRRRRRRHARRAAGGRGGRRAGRQDGRGPPARRGSRDRL